jgi:hypothetical protein
MYGHTHLNIAHYMKTSRFLSVLMAIGAIWNLLNAQSSAQSFSLELSAPRPSSSVHTLSRHPSVLTQNPTGITTNFDISKDLQLQGISVTRNSSDKSLLTVTGLINNRSDQSHYVYYIVAKFISKDISIKQVIIPVNIDIEPGKSKPFTHEISTDSNNSIAPETVKPVVVKYEYR